MHVRLLLACLAGRAADVLAFLIDFGIGNALEKNAAIQSADDRIAHLKEMREKEGCTPPLQSVKSDW